jgi:hypothetical protein
MQKYLFNIMKDVTKSADKVIELMNKCKFSVTISINPHKNAHKSVADFLQLSDDELNVDGAAAVYVRMKQLDTIIKIEFYPDNSVIFHRILHYDLDIALSQALDCFKD